MRHSGRVVVDTQLVRALAGLARLEVPHEQEQQLAGELGKILGYVQELSEDVVGLSQGEGGLGGLGRREFVDLAIEREVLLGQSHSWVPDRGMVRLPARSKRGAS